MICRRPYALAAAALALSLMHGVQAADNFPTRSVRIVVPVAAGGWGDMTTRLIAERMSAELGQPVVVENRTGAGGLVGIRHVKSENPDGYTLVSTGGTIAIQQALNADPGYDAMKDFVMVGHMVRSPALAIASTTTPYNNMAELFAAAKDNPGQISYGSAGVGTTTHIAAEMLLRQVGVKMLHVPYKGNGAAMPDVVAGRIGFMIDAYSSSAANLNGGRLRALGAASSESMKALPDVLTIASQGAPGYQYYYWLGLFAPAGTPVQAVNAISGALRKALNDPKLRDRLESNGSEPYFLAPDDFRAFVQQEIHDTTALVEDLNLPKQ